MSEPMSADAVAAYHDDCADMEGRGDWHARAAATIRAAVTSRVAAVELAKALTAKTADYERAVIQQGRRRERDAVIVWLQSDASQLGFLGFEASNAISRGEHLPSAGAAGEG